MKDLREKCEKLLIKADKYNPEPFTYEDIEAFAREIASQARLEALEEASAAVQAIPTFDRVAGPRYAKYFSESVQATLRSLKTATEDT